MIEAAAALQGVLFGQADGPALPREPGAQMRGRGFRAQPALSYTTFCSRGCSLDLLSSFKDFLSSWGGGRVCSRAATCMTGPRVSPPPLLVVPPVCGSDKWWQISDLRIQALSSGTSSATDFLCYLRPVLDFSELQVSCSK